jgi:signal transduction histidine kinase/CheY-like chemotaxis protein
MAFAKTSVLEISALNQSPILLSSYLGVLEDSTGSLTLDDVQKEDVAERFQTDLTLNKPLNMSYTSSVYWLRLELKNNSDKPVESILAVDHPLLENLDFYFQTENKHYQTIHTGYSQPFESRAYKSRIFAFPIVLPVHSNSTIYLRVQTQNAMILPVLLWKPSDFHIEERNNYSVQAIYFGLVIAIVLLNLVFALVLKEFDYLLYVGMIVFVALVLIANRGFGSEFLWHNLTLINRIAPLSFGSIAMVLQLFFIRRMLVTPILVPKIDGVLKFFIGLQIFIPVVLLLNFQFAKFVPVFFAISALLVLIVSIIGMLKRKRNAYFLFTAFSLLAIGIIGNAMLVWAIIPTNFFTVHSAQIGSALEIIVFTFLLIDRYQLIRDEKQKNAIELRISNDKNEFLNLQITKRKQVEKQIEKQTDELLIAKFKAEEANRAKSIFIATMSHEIRTPMNAILGFSEILSTLITDSTHKYYLNAIQRSGKTLLQLINDILDLSKIEADKITLQYKPISIKNIFNDINIIFSQQAIEKSLGFSVSIDEKCPDCMLLDEIRLRQILLNLVANSIKFTKEGEIKIALSVLYVDVEGKKIDLLIDVWDSGIGIPEAQQEDIFLAFTQQKNQSVEYGGTGLGLTICQKLLQLMDGHIFVSSAEGTGSCFSVILKNVLVVDDEIKNKIVNEEQSIKQIRFEPARILLVDDVTINRELVRAFLTEFDELTFVEASTGEEALNRVKQQSFDLIFMDRQLPDIYGDKVCEKMKVINSHTPIIMISASVVKDEDKAPVFYDIQLNKPVNKNTLLKAICTYLTFIEREIKPDDLLKSEIQSDMTIDSEKLSKLLAAYKDEFREIRYSDGFNVSSLVETAEQLIQIAEKYHCLSLKEWANTLKSQADLFDIVNLSQTLSCFDKLCDSIAFSGKITR